MSKSNRKSSKSKGRKPQTMPAKAAFQRERVVHHEMFDWDLDGNGRLMDAAGRVQLATVLINSEIGTDADRRAFELLIESAPILWRLVSEALPAIHDMISDDRYWGDWYADAVSVLKHQQPLGALERSVDSGLLALRTAAAGFNLSQDDRRRADERRKNLTADALEKIRLLGNTFGVKAAAK